MILILSIDSTLLFGLKIGDREKFSRELYGIILSYQNIERKYPGQGKSCILESTMERGRIKW